MEVLKKRGKEMSNDRKNIEVLYKLLLLPLLA